jgi:hypothetical protein
MKILILHLSPSKGLPSKQVKYDVSLEALFAVMAIEPARILMMSAFPSGRTEQVAEVYPLSYFCRRANTTRKPTLSAPALYGVILNFTTSLMLLEHVVHPKGNVPFANSALQLIFIFAAAGVLWFCITISKSIVALNWLLDG